MLCADEVLNLDIDCSVDVGAGEFACAKISNIRLDIRRLQQMIEPILRELVNPPEDDGYFDEVIVPLLFVDDRIPGISDIAGVSTMLY